MHDFVIIGQIPVTTSKICTSKNRSGDPKGNRDNSFWGNVVSFKNETFKVNT